MKISFLTLFPNFYNEFLKSKVISRAIEKGIISIDVVDIRNYSQDKHRHIDDTPYGGGAGMVMRVDVVSNAIRSNKNQDSYTILLGPKGTVFNQKVAKRLKEKKHLIFVSGHYEGIDHRISYDIDEEMSIGDYILTGGELSSQVIADSIIRILDGAIRSESAQEESFENQLLEYPQYTRPFNFEGKVVPEILLSGNHNKIRLFRLKESLRETFKKRPDLLENRNYSLEELKLLEEIKNEDKSNTDRS